MSHSQKQHRYQKGMSLVEVTIAMAIGLIVTLGAGYLISQSRQVQRKVVVQNDMDRAHYIMLQMARSSTFLSRELGMIDDRGRPVDSTRNRNLASCLAGNPLPGVNCSQFSSGGTVRLKDGSSLQNKILKYFSKVAFFNALTVTPAQAQTQEPMRTTTTTSTLRQERLPTTTTTTAKKVGTGGPGEQHTTTNGCTGEMCGIESELRWNLNCSASGCEPMSLEVETWVEQKEPVGDGPVTSARSQKTTMAMPGYLLGQRYDLDLSCAQTQLLTGINHKTQDGLCNGIVGGDNLCDPQRPLRTFASDRDACQNPVNHRCNVTGFAQVNLQRGICTTATASPPCAPVNCTVSGWSYTPWGYSDPVNNCGQWQRTGNRTITQEPSCGGTSCPNLSTIETDPAQYRACPGTPVNCTLGPEELISTSFTDPVGLCGVRTDTYVRPIVTPESNGGTCPSLEDRTRTQDTNVACSCSGSASGATFASNNTMPGTCIQWRNAWLNNSRNYINSLSISATHKNEAHAALSNFNNWIMNNYTKTGEEFYEVQGRNASIRWRMSFGKLGDWDVTPQIPGPPTEQNCHVSVSFSSCP